MTFPTYEQYNENEYFLKFKQIHPYIYYTNDKYYNEKRTFQLKLLEKLEKNEINEDQFKEIYLLLVKKENDKFTYLESIKQIHKNIIKDEEECINKEIHDYMNFII
jgi:hypothetical protein